METEEWKLLCLAVGRIQPPPFLPHSTCTTFSLPDTHQHGKYTSHVKSRYTSREMTASWDVNGLFKLALAGVILQIPECLLLKLESSFFTSS